MTDTTNITETITGINNKLTGNQIKVTQVRSAINRDKAQEKILIGLGLNKLHRVRIVKNNQSIRGMINKIKHLLQVEVI